jgi:valyl-tRNA synthetase
MNEIAKTYSPADIEAKWYAYWKENGFFRSVPDQREPYTIVIPPPNVTGVLHMGHMLNNTIQDVLIRRARMLGKNACWVPGTDHASIATEAKVVAMLKEQGINKSDLSREEFLKYAWEWKEKYGGIILNQLEKLGASCDWERTRFTMENDLSEAVIDVFIDLYRKGQIYRGVRMVNWDPQGLTAVSDEEVIRKEVMQKLYYVRYAVVDANEKFDTMDATAAQAKFADGKFITIATVRPETILGDSAVCIHPDDERYKNFHGKNVAIPYTNRTVPVICDEYVTMDFGTGALKVTPAHDVNDYNLGIKHKLEVINIFNENGTMHERAGKYTGEDRFAVRKKIAADLQADGYLIKTEDYKSQVGYSERTNAAIEPRLSMQWFLKMDKIAQPALENVLNGNIKLIPDKFLNTYKHWMENVHDWCISRQLWWGQRIPSWYNETGDFMVAKTEEEARKLFGEYNSKLLAQGGKAVAYDILHQDEDVLDTWFSSWLWPISVFDGFKDPNNADIKYYYPTNDLITAPEILFFWVARMIIAGYEYRNEKPFTNVYLTGIVRDKLGRKMSKSLGNSPDPLELITKYSADGVRVGMLFSSPAGNDLPFDEGLCEQGRNFANKIWNAFRLINGWTVSKDVAASSVALAAIEWYKNKLSATVAELNELYDKYRISDVLLATYKLVWDDFCAWYLELVKPEFINGVPQPISQTVYDETVLLFEQNLIVLHPFMPFITEELWHTIRKRDENDCCIVATWPKVSHANEAILKQFEHAQQIVMALRNMRAAKHLSPKEALEFIYTKSNYAGNVYETVAKLANVKPVLSAKHNATQGTYTLMVDTSEYYIPLEGKTDTAADKKKAEEEIAYLEGFLKSVDAKLSNEKFVANAKPEVIENERKKRADAVSKMEMLKRIF